MTERIEQKMVYYVKLDQGEYLELQGGLDWGRTNRYLATRFDSRSEAWRWARRLQSLDARVCRESAI
jgi:hypothetical protein